MAREGDDYWREPCEANILCALHRHAHQSPGSTTMKNPRVLAGLALAALLGGACADADAGPTAPGGARYNGGLYGSGGRSDGSGTAAAAGVAPGYAGGVSGGETGGVTP
jgi:hypothetical protein